jgi:histidine triad (HIT) family protein
MDCIFCKIIKKEIPSKIVCENDKVIVFEDIEPKAKIHLLIVPKKHIVSVNDLELSDKDLIAELILTAKKIAKDKNLSESGYRIVLNVGKDAGQTVEHVHLHLMGGEKLSWS